MRADCGRGVAGGDALCVKTTSKGNGEELHSHRKSSKSELTTGMFTSENPVCT